MDLIPAPLEFLQGLATLELPPSLETRLAKLSAIRELGPLSPDAELEFQSWTSMRDQFTYLRTNAQRLLREHAG